MTDKLSKDRVILYLALPPILLFLLVLILLAAMGHQSEETLVMAGFILSLFILTFLVEIYIFRKSIIPQITETDKIQRLLQDQERSGKLLIRRDLELTKANDKLKELDERKSEFVSIVAHQLRTPLSGVKWTLDLLINGEFGELTSEQRAFLMKSYESNQRLIALIDDMLNVDRIESGKYQYVFRDIQIIDLFDNVLFEINPTIIKKNITVRFDPNARSLPKVHVDPDKIRAVVQNLLDNAVKYTPVGGLIFVHTGIDGEFVKICIKDSGIGIPEDQKRLIFNRFFRARNAIKVQTDGSGLGLFIVKSIIEKHGGDIWFQSEEGKGTEFCFTLKASTEK
jgi:two-component system NtrC family sensor kinase